MMRKPRSLFQKIVSTAVAGTIFYFLFNSLLENYHKLSLYNFDPEYNRIIFSYVLLVLVLFFNPFGWMKVLSELNERMSFTESFSIFYISQLGKYVPGKLWTYLMQIHMADKKGISKEKTFISSVLFQLISMGTTVIAFVVSLLFWDNFNFSLRVIVVGLFLILILVIIWSGFLNVMTNFILNKVLKQKIVVNLSNLTLIHVILILMASWIAYGVAYYHFINSFYPISVISSIQFSGIYAISWLIGYLSFLTPGGLGIREGIQAYLLSFFLPLPISIIISLACRIWITAGEIAVALIAFLFIVKQKR